MLEETRTGLAGGTPANNLTRRWNMSKVLTGIPRVGIALALAFCVMGCLAAMVLVYHGFPDLPGVQGAGIDDGALVQVVMPGEAEVVLPEAGAYGVYYEYQTDVAGIEVGDAGRPPDLACALISQDTGGQIIVAPDHAPANSYRMGGGRRAGVLVGSVTVKSPGAYLFSCRSLAWRAQPPAVMAIGPNLGWEAIGWLVKAVGTLAAGLLVLAGAGLTAGAGLILAARVRQGRRERTRDGLLA
jgi:hypothetical protein